MQAESLDVLEKASVAPALATKHDLSSLGAALRGEMVALKAELRVEMAALAAALRTEMTTQGAELRAEMHRMLSNHTRQMYLALLGQMSVMLGFLLLPDRASLTAFRPAHGNRPG